MDVSLDGQIGNGTLDSGYFFIAEQSAGNKNGDGRRPANRYHEKVAA